MASVNDIISKDDYNDLRATTVQILGDSSSSTPSYGYGQEILSTAVTQSDIVSVNEWGRLKWDITNIYLHQNGTVPGTSPSTDDPILDLDANSIISVDTSSNTTPYPYWENLLATLTTNRGQETLSTRRITTNHTDPLPGYTSRWGDPTAQELRCDVTVTFTTSQQARHFFNSGSHIRLQSYFTPQNDPGTSQEEHWESMLSSAGSQKFGGFTSLDFLSLTSSYQQLYTISDSSPYAANTYQIWVKSDVSNNSNGSAKQITLQLRYIDGYSEPPVIPDPNTGVIVDPAPTDGVDGTLELSVISYEAYGSMQGGAATFEVETPTVSVGLFYVA